MLNASFPDPPTMILHATRRVVEVQGRSVELSDRLFSMLTLLAQGRVVTRSELARAARLEDQSSRRCESLLVDLRRIIGPDLIRNLRRRGWILVAAVEIRQD